MYIVLFWNVFIINVILHILCILYIIICFVVINITVEESIALKKTLKMWS